MLVCCFLVFGRIERYSAQFHNLRVKSCQYSRRHMRRCGCRPARSVRSSSKTMRQPPRPSAAHCSNLGLCACAATPCSLRPRRIASAAPNAGRRLRDVRIAAVGVEGAIGTAAAALFSARTRCGALPTTVRRRSRGADRMASCAMCVCRLRCGVPRSKAMLRGLWTEWKRFLMS